MSAWIATSDRKPEDEQHILGYWPGDGKFMASSMESLQFYAKDAPDSRERWVDAFDNDSDEPTHWMPVPNPPHLQGHSE